MRKPRPRAELTGHRPDGQKLSIEHILQESTLTTIYNVYYSLFPISAAKLRIFLHITIALNQKIVKIPKIMNCEL